MLEYKAKKGLQADVNKAESNAERLQAKLEKFEGRVRNAYPSLEAVEIRTANSPGSVPLLLPSTFSAADRIQLGLQGLTHAEREL